MKQSSYLSICHSLENHSIPVCLLRDEILLIDEQDEIDLLVLSNKKKEAEEVILSLGWEILDQGLFIPHKKTFFLYENNHLLKIDLHFELIDYGLIYMDALDFMKNTSFINGIRVPNREYWLIHVLLHTILGKNKLAKKYHVRFNQLLNNSKIIDAANALITRYKLNRVIPKLTINSLNEYTDESHSFQIIKRKLRKKLLLTKAGNLTRVIYQKFIWPIGQLIGLRRGFTIAFIGPDGAGKSTTIETLSKRLHQFSIPVRTVYMGPWEYPILPTTKWLRKMGCSPRDEIPGSEQYLSKKIKGIIKRYLYYFNTIIEVWARYCIKVIPRLLMRRVVLLDRFVFDIEVGFYNNILTNSVKLRQLISAISPKPSITVLLLNDPKIIWARKKEYPLDVITCALNKYKEVGSRHNAITLNTNQPVEHMIEKFIENNWRDLIRLRKEGWFR